MISEVLNHQQCFTVDDFSKKTISINLRETVLVVLKH